MEILFICLISFIFIIIGMYSIQNYKKKIKHFRIESSEVIATIVKIIGIHGNRKAFISYTVLENHYNEVELNYYSSSMRIGDSIKLYVNNNAPHEIFYIGKGPVAISILFIVIGIILPIIWFVF